MSGLYLWIKWLHILSSTVLFGMGAGIAFFFLRACRGGDVQVIAAVGRDVVLADAIFTTLAVILQPLTGLAMVNLLHYPLNLPWLKGALCLYGVAGACWLPVVWLQVRMRDLAVAAARGGTPLPAIFHRYRRWWFALGWPAFAAVLAIFYLMVMKPGG